MVSLLLGCLACVGSLVVEEKAEVKGGVMDVKVCHFHVVVVTI